MVKAAFTHTNKTIRPINEPTYEQDEQEQYRPAAGEGVSEQVSPSKDSTPVEQADVKTETPTPAPSPSDQFFTPTTPAPAAPVEEPEAENGQENTLTYTAEDQLPRRIAGRADDETYKALRSLALELDKPTWLVMATIVRDALVEHRMFEPEHVPEYSKERRRR